MGLTNIFGDVYGIVLVRSALYRFTEREMFAVNEWIESHFLFHTIRDLDIHVNRLLVEGLWGVKLLPNKQLKKDLVKAVLAVNGQLKTNFIKTRLGTKKIQYKDEKCMHYLRT